MLSAREKAFQILADLDRAERQREKERNMQLIKLFWHNLQDKTTTGASVMLILAWVLNTYCSFIPKDVMDAILVIAGALVLALLSKKGTLPVK